MDPRIQSLLESGAQGNFVNSLVNQYAERGRLSDKQWYWVNRLTNEATNPAPQATIDVGDFSGVVALFAKAGETLKYPKINLGFGGPSGFANRLRLSVAGPRSKYRGQIQLTDGGSYGENTYYGRVSTDGQLTLSRSTQNDEPVRDALIAQLRRLAEKPEEIAAEYARFSGNCCFCHKAIGEGDDPRSREAGYGPQCAKRYGLPWGGKS